MTSEINVCVKDSIKLDILQEVLSGKLCMMFQLNDGETENYATEIHNERSRVRVYGKFNLAEDPSGQILTIRPVGPDCLLRMQIFASAGFSGKKISLVRSATKTLENEFELTSDTSAIELIPCGKQNYNLRISYGDTCSLVSDTAIYMEQTDTPVDKKQMAMEFDEFAAATVEVLQDNGPDDRFVDFSLEFDSGVDDRFFESLGAPDELTFKDDFTDDTLVSAAPTKQPAEQMQKAVPVDEADGICDDELRSAEREITIVERKQRELAQKKKSAIAHLEKIEAEYKKDYAALEMELEEIKSRMEADASIIEYYMDQDVLPVETLFQEINLKLIEAETQIRRFVEAKQRKTMAIEDAIKSNKK